jgi:hypothetical protein
MSEANVELARQAYDALNRRDQPAFLALMHADVGGRMRGRAAGSDTPLDPALWTAAEWRDGKCLWWGTYDTEAEAVQAVRLRE